MRDLDVSIERLTRLMPDTPPDERPGIDGLVARYRGDRAAETPKMEALFAQLEEERVEDHLARYMAKHTGIRLQKLNPAPPED